MSDWMDAHVASETERIDMQEKHMTYLNEVLNSYYPTDSRFGSYLDGVLSGPGNEYRIGTTLASYQCALHCLGLRLQVVPEEQTESEKAMNEIERLPNEPHSDCCGVELIWPGPPVCKNCGEEVL